MKNKIYILPTKSGLIAFLIMGVMLLTGASYSNNLIYLLSFILFSLAVVAMIATHKNLVRVQLCFLEAESSFTGEKAKLLFQLTTQARKTHHSLDIEIQDSKAIRSHGRVEVLHNDRPSIATLDLPLKHRGKFEIFRVKLSTIYPLGFFYAWCWVPVNVVYFSYPRPEGQADLPHNHQSIEEDSKGTPTGIGTEFKEHRPFITGDSFRHVDWRAVARGLPLLTKVYAGESPAVLQVNWEQTHGRSIEDRLSQMALWVKLAHENSIPFSFQMPNVQLAASVGPHHYHECLRILAEHA